MRKVTELEDEKKDWHSQKNVCIPLGYLENDDKSEERPAQRECMRQLSVKNWLMAIQHEAKSKVYILVRRFPVVINNSFI